MALLKKQADLIEGGFYILEEPSSEPSRFKVGPLQGEGTLKSTISGQFSDYHMSERQCIGAPFFSFDRKELLEFLVTSSHSADLITMFLGESEKESYVDLFNKTQKDMKGALTKAVLYTSVKQEMTEFLSIDEFAYLTFTGLKNKTSGYLYGFYNPICETAVLGCSPEYLFKTNKNKQLVTVAVAGTQPKEEDNWTDKLYEEHAVVMSGVDERLVGGVQWGDVNVCTYGELKHLRSEGVLPATIEIKELSQQLHPTPAVGTLPHEYFKDYELGPQKRGHFGGYAEFLIGDSPFSLVTIRCFEWRRKTLQVCIGGGVLKESRVEDEWAELALKWNAFKKLWGLI